MSGKDSIERRAMKLAEMAMDLPSNDRLAWLKAQKTEPPEAVKRAISLIIADGSGGSALRTGGAGTDAGETPAPEQVGAYRIDSIIGRGGMGAVYVGQRTAGDFEHKVAIKIIRPGVLSESLIERFERERQILANLNYPGIARLFDGGKLDDGSPYIIMEYVDGRPITEWVESRDVSLLDRLWMFADVVRAVRHAHQNLIVHRDITPSNVLVTESGSVKLIDFGIAKQQTDITTLSENPTSISAPSLSSLSFTPGFAAPERATGAPANTLSDIFSLGKLLEAILPRESLNNSAELSAIVKKSIQTVPADRYKSADALLDDIENYLTDRPVEARNGGPTYIFSKFFKRRRYIVSGVVLSTTLLLGAFLVTLFQYNKAEAARLRADARFEDARELSRRIIFETYDSFEKISGTLEPRRALADVIRDYTDKLASDPHAPTDILTDIGVIKMRLSDIYGGVGVANLGDTETSATLLLEAENALEGVIAETPHDMSVLAELIMIKRMITMQTLLYELDNKSATHKNEETLALARKAVELSSTETERPVLRHLWSARTDRLRILLTDAQFELALQELEVWRAELDDEMFKRLGGGEEMAAYLASQHTEILLELDRPDEALEAIAYTVAYRTEKLNETEDSYYELTQLMVARNLQARAARDMGDIDVSVAYAEAAVDIGRRLKVRDETDLGSIEGLGKMLQTLALSASYANDKQKAVAAINEATELHKSLVTNFPTDPYYINDYAGSLVSQAETYVQLGDLETACQTAARAKEKYTHLQTLNPAYDIKERHDDLKLLETNYCT